MEKCKILYTSLKCKMFKKLLCDLILHDVFLKL